MRRLRLDLEIRTRASTSPATSRTSSVSDRLRFDLDVDEEVGAEQLRRSRPCRGAGSRRAARSHRVLQVLRRIPRPIVAPT